MDVYRSYVAFFSCHENVTLVRKYKMFLSQKINTEVISAIKSLKMNQQKKPAIGHDVIDAE